MHSETTRRRWLGGCASAAAVGLAGCLKDGFFGISSGGSDDGGEDDDGGSGDGSDDDGDDDSVGAGADQLVTSVGSYAYDGVEEMDLMGMPSEDTFTGEVDRDGNWQQQTVTQYGEQFEEALVDGRLYYWDPEDGCDSMSASQEAFSMLNFYEARASLVGDGEGGTSTTFEGQAVEAFEFGMDELSAAGESYGAYGIEDARETVYVRTDDDYIVGIEQVTVMENSDTTTTWHLHSFDEEFTVEAPSGC